MNRHHADSNPGASPSRSAVVVAECPSYSSENIPAALAETAEALGGTAAFIEPGQTVLLKPNLFTAHPPGHAVTTHPKLVRHVILLCKKAGAGAIWVGDSPVGAQDEENLWSTNCPRKAIQILERTGYPRIDQKNCIACFCRMESCPRGAIALQLYLGSLFCTARKRQRKASK